MTTETEMLKEIVLPPSLSGRYSVQPVFLGKYSPGCIGTGQNAELVHSIL